MLLVNKHWNNIASNENNQLLPPYTHLGDVEEIFNPLGVSLGASES
jgi:hypothetical protein